MQINIKSLYQIEQVRELDRIAIEEFNIPGFVLMQRAGKAALNALRNRWPEAKKVFILCGKGNNAGDGYVLASLAQQAKLDVTVLYLEDPQHLKGDALLAAQDAIKHRVNLLPFSHCRGEKSFAQKSFAQPDIIIDALLGTGLQGEVSGEYKTAISYINDAGLPVMAIDVPSGLNADTGNPLGLAVRANLTMTFIAAKRGFFTGQAANYCGEILLDDLDVPKEIFDKLISTAELLHIQPLLARKPSAYKGNFGHVLVIGGDYGMAGAVRMAAEAAARTGAGLVSVATRPEHIAAVSGMRPELMCYGITGEIGLEQLIAKATVIVLGPGLGQSSWSKKLWEIVVKTEKPLVVDADALNLLAENPLKNANWILTPHPGEAARLLKCDVPAVQSDRFTAAHNLQNHYAGVCVLKGAGTLVLGKSHKITICPYGNVGMATGGMGDILSGVIGGLLAQGLESEQAARLGVTIHSRAADLAAQEQGQRGLLATDLLPFIRKLVNYAD